MSTAEVVAYLTGARVRHDSGGIAGFLMAPEHVIASALEDDEASALRRLGRDMWAYWVRRGWDEAG